MIIALDIGNTRTKIGRFRGVSSEAEAGADGGAGADHVMIPDVITVDTAALPEAALKHMEGSAGLRVGVSSVVPAQSEKLVAGLEAAGFGAPFRVRPGIRLPFVMAYETPETLGNDRLAAAAGAWMMFGESGRPMIVVDAGTAVTYEAISANGRYLGGAIAPGPGLMGAALGTGTAQLPAVQVSGQLESALGRSTVEAIRSGLHWGFVDAVTGMIQRLEEELGGDAVVLATGGWAEWLASQTSCVKRVDPFLVLHGVRLLTELNAE